MYISISVSLSPNPLSTRLSHDHDINHAWPSLSDGLPFLSLLPFHSHSLREWRKTSTDIQEIIWLGCVNHMCARAGVTQTSPHIILHICIPVSWKLGKIIWRTVHPLLKLFLWSTCIFWSKNVRWTIGDGMHFARFISLNEGRRAFVQLPNRGRTVTERWSQDARKVGHANHIKFGAHYIQCSLHKINMLHC